MVGCARWVTPLLITGALVTGVTVEATGQTDAEWTEVYALPRSVRGGWLGDLYAGGPADIWAVGRRATVHFDGTTWTLVPDHSDAGLFQVEGTSAGVLAIGSNQTVERWNGTEWVLEHRDHRLGLRRGSLQQLIAAASGAILVGPYEPMERHADGSWVDIDDAAWSAAFDAHWGPAPCERDRRTPPTDVHARCADGTAYVRVGGAWRPFDLRLPARRAVTAIAVSGDTMIVTLTNGDLFTRIGGTWAHEADLSRTGHDVVIVGRRAYVTDHGRILARDL